MAAPYSDKPPAYSEKQGSLENPGANKPQEIAMNPPPDQVGYISYPVTAAPGQDMSSPAQPLMATGDTAQVEAGEPTFLFSEKSVRQAFIRKVFMILSAQLVVTTAICAVFYFVKDIRDFLAANQWMYWISYGIFLVTYISLVCSRTCSRRTPLNYFALAALTLAVSYMVATITGFYDVESVMLAFGITVVLCVSLTIFAWQTCIDFTMCSGLIFCLAMILIITGNVCWIWGVFWGWNRVLFVVYGGVGALVFSAFLVFDVQRVIGNRQYQLSPEEYVYATVEIYLDVVNLFLSILRMFGKK